MRMMKVHATVFFLDDQASHDSGDLVHTEVGFGAGINLDKRPHQYLDAIT